jgi:hypothetical protein
MVIGGQYIAIESAPVDSLTDLSQQEFIEDLDAWTRRGRLQLTVLISACSLAATLLALRVPPIVQVAVGILCLVALLFVRGVELRRRQYYLLFDLDETAETRFKAVGAAFERMARGGILNSVRLEHVHGDWKRHAGATTTVHSDDAHLDRQHPRHVSSNLESPPIRLRAQGMSLYFFPDRLLIEKAGRKAAVSYSALTVSCRDVSMRWFGTVPVDAKTVGQSWRYVNKNGTPDRRFNNNYVVPIILLAECGFETRSGLEVVLQTSATRAASETADEIRALGNLVGAVELLTSTSVDQPGSAVSPPGTVEERPLSHRFESVQILRAAPTWRDLSVSTLFDAIARDGGLREANKAGLTAFLSDFRDLVIEFDECTRRTAIAGGAEVAAKLVGPIGDLRSNLLRALGSGMSKAASQIELGSEHEQLRTYLTSLADNPGTITSFRAEHLG